MGGHFHDIAAGTATPKAYEFAWNDDVIAMNQFAGVLSNATEGVAAALNTETKGVPLVVFNPLNIAREDVVEAERGLSRRHAEGVRVTGPDGKEVPAQISNGKVIFVAKAPSVGYAVYDVQPGAGRAPHRTLRVSENSLENQYYRVKLNADGDVASIFDKSIAGNCWRRPRAWRSPTTTRAVAGLEHGLGPGAGRAESICRRSGEDSRRGKRSGARGSGSFARNRGLAICPDHQPFGGRCGEASRVRQRDRLEHAKNRI